MRATRTCYLLLLLLSLLAPAVVSSQNTNFEIPYFTVLSPASLRASYSLAATQYGTAQFGNGLANGDIVAELVMPPDSLFCDTTLAANFSGKIVLIPRGVCEFGLKVLNAQRKGAVGVIIFNRDETVVNMSGGSMGNLVAIPSIMVPFSVGNALRSALLQGSTVRVGFSSLPLGFALVSGTVRYDQNNNCQPETAEQGLGSWIITAQGNGHTATAATNNQGAYTLSIDSLGIPYTLSATPLYGSWSVCGSIPPVTSLTSGAILTRDVAATPGAPCPVLRTTIALARLRRCFPNAIAVTVCNLGTEVTEGAYVDVHLQTPEFEPISNASMPYTVIAPGEYRFNLGNLAIGACVDLNLTARIACGDTTTLGQTLCIEAQAHPDTLCTASSVGWNGASVGVTAQCKGNKVELTIRNKGIAPMANASEFIIIEDDVMFQDGSIQLSPNGTKTIEVPANGSTWRLEATQVPFHPVPQNPAVTIEGCNGSSGNFTTGYFMMFPIYDPSPAFDRHCMEIIGAYDPNDKQGFPKGVGEQHLIAANTDIQYLIRFQNTGTDTAFNVVIRDTLTEFLDPRSIVPGAASAKYTLEIQNGNILIFRFPNIQLVDSFTNERLSHGYIYFKVNQMRDLPDGLRIQNRAGIFFDYNPPVLTNYTDHVVGYIPHVTTSTNSPSEVAPELELYPNPAHPGAVLRFKNELPDGTRWRLYDTQGRLYATGTLVKNALPLPSSALPSGNYRIELVKNQQRVGTGRLIVAGNRE